MGDYVGPMRCAYCGVEKHYPQDFPLLHWAECRTCLIARKEDELREAIRAKRVAITGAVVAAAATIAFTLIAVLSR